MDSHEQTLQSLVLKRGQLKAQITRFQNFLDNFNCENSDILQIETRLTRIEGILDSFDDIQNQIELLSEFQIQETERNSFEESYYAVIAKAKTVLNEFKSRAQKDASSTPSPDQLGGAVDRNVFDVLSPMTQTPSVTVHKDAFGITSKVKLPNITLPDFHGLYNQWMTFYDTFNTLIHDNKELSNIQKFHYLKSCLKEQQLN